MRHFDQEGMLCYPFRVGSDTIYKFQFKDPVEKNGHSLEFNCGGKTHLIPCYHWEPRKPEERTKKGLLLTFRRAGEGLMAEIAPEVFDKAISDLKLELITPTRMQRVKDTRVLNGNRYCVVDIPQNVNIIPESIPIVHPVTKQIRQVKITYKGQQRYCDRCNDMHVGQCPSMAAFYEARDKKEKMRDEGEVKTKLIGTSGLRNVDPLGLCADAITMSEGELGQVIQASMDDPTIGEYDTVVLFGGENDIKQQNFNSNELFASNVDKSLTKLALAAEQVPEKNFVMV